VTDETQRPERPSDALTNASWARGWLSDSALLLTAQILTVVATSVAAITIARTLDPDDWGIFSAFLGLSLALALVANFGLATWLLRELTAMRAEGTVDPERVGQLVSASVVINVAVALPLVVGAAVWAAVARPGVGVSLALMCLLAFGAMSAAGSALEAHIRSRREVRLVLVVSFLEKGVLLVLLLAAAALDAGLGAIGLAYLLAGVMRIGFDAFVVFGRPDVNFVVPSPRATASVARASSPFALSAAALNLIPRLDTFILAAMSTTSAAWFAIGDRSLGPALIVPATLGSALYPFMTSSSAKRVAPWKLSGALGALGAALAVLGILLAPVLVPLLFGHDYQDAVPVTQVMLLVVPVVYATSPLLVIAYSHGRERSLLVPIVVLSLAGTLAIVAGQAAGGATLAAAGYVARSLLFLVVIGAVAFVAWRREGRGAADSADVSTPGRVSAQVP